MIDGEITDFSVWIRRDPARDRFEAARMRQAVTLCKNQPLGTGAARAGIPKLCIYGVWNTEHLIVRSKQRSHFTLLRTRRGIGSHNDAVVFSS
jgi:hypothetical protein